MLNESNIVPRLRDTGIGFRPGGGGGEERMNYYVKGAGMLLILFMCVNYGFRYHLGFLGSHANIFSHPGMANSCTRICRLTVLVVPDPPGM